MQQRKLYKPIGGALSSQETRILCAMCQFFYCALYFIMNQQRCSCSNTCVCIWLLKPSASPICPRKVWGSLLKQQLTGWTLGVALLIGCLRRDPPHISRIWRRAGCNFSPVGVKFYLWLSTCLVLHWSPEHSSYLGLARTIYIRFIYGIFYREFTKYTVIYGEYIRFWPTLYVMCTGAR